MSPLSPDLRRRLLDGEPTVGAFLNLGSPLAAEICGLAGLDWVLVDYEHGTVHEADLLAHVLAADAGGVPLLVRVETASRPRIGRALDNGATGIMVPRIDTAEQASEAIGYMRYAPAGDRGVATYNRACAFGTKTDAMEQANENVVGVIQIESPEAVSAVEQIASVPGADVLFVGPGDLSHAMGRFGQVEDPEFLEACARVVDTANVAGKVAGILVPSPERIGWAVDLGFRFIAVGSDSTLLLAAARQIRAGLPTGLS